jgi:hypothetical protein
MGLVLIEGIITVALGLAGFFLLPGPAEKTRFLNEREKMIAVQRLMNDGDDGNTAVSPPSKPLISTTNNEF